MNNIEPDMNNINSFYKNGGPVYLFSNENIPYYLGQQGDLTGKTVLAVAASGDHAFQSYHMGAKHVDTFDANIWQKSVQDLKTHMINHISYEDFMDFFFSPSDQYNLKILAPIYKQLPQNVKQLFTMRQELGDKKLFCANPLDYKKPNKYYYQSKENFENLRDKLPQSIPFTHITLDKLATQTNKKYDIILLSNIFGYMYPNMAPNTKKLMRMYNEILKPLADNNLNDNGDIFLHYYWAEEDNDYITALWPSAINNTNHKIAENNHSICKHSIPSLRKDTWIDTVTVMHKEKTR